MLKKIFFMILLLVSMSSICTARTEITADEAKTVSVLTNLGIIEKDRTEEDLNQPLSAIDSMSMEIKSLIVSKEDMISRDKEIIDRLNSKIINLEEYSTQIESDLIKKDLEFKDAKRDSDFHSNLHYLIELGLFLFILGK